MYWSPPGYEMGDPTIIRVGDEYHFFTEALPRNKRPIDLRNRVIYHAVSKDALNWQELPHVIEVGPAGSFDGFTLYHFDVYVHQGTWYLFYTGLDKPGVGQKQATGLATSRDGIHWEKHPKNPIDFADPRFYEQAIPPEATYQKKDLGRLWYRDPSVFRNPKTGEFGMVTIARDLRKPADTRGCIAWSTSRDLVHWTQHPPIYSPNRFHTIEVPAMFEHGGRHYLTFLTHWNWGTPYLTTDPYQTAGNLYAVSENGWTGPYVQPKDEILIGAAGQPRLASQRIIEGLDGRKYLYGELLARPAAGDSESRIEPATLVPMLKPVEFQSDGAIHVRYPAEQLNALLKPTEINPSYKPEITTRGWRWSDGRLECKSFRDPSRVVFGPSLENVVFCARIHFTAGERAGLVVRANAGATEGWQIMLDRRARRVEFKTIQPLLPTKAAYVSPVNELNDHAGASDGSVPSSLGDFIDARAWQPKDDVELKIVANSVVLEVYVDDRMMLNQARHHEVTGQVGFVVERAHARFSDYRLSRF